MAAGDLSHQVRLTGPQEIADLAAGVEAMRRRILTDVEAERFAQQQLSELNAELTRSNEDLEQFAYTASHDLQEPLRKVASFCLLLEERYQGTLDERADQYIELAVDGATRMQTLVDELLTFSRVGRGAEPFAPVPLQECVDLAGQNLALAVVDAAAEIKVSGPLPTVSGNAQLLTSLFQNLIRNAIRFRSDVPLAIRINAARNEDDWLLAVSDNGIGIDPRFAEKIFVVFQQLNRRDTYAAPASVWRSARGSSSFTVVASGSTSTTIPGPGCALPSRPHWESRLRDGRWPVAPRWPER